MQPHPCTPGSRRLGKTRSTLQPIAPGHQPGHPDSRFRLRLYPQARACQRTPTPTGKQRGDSGPPLRPAANEHHSTQPCALVVAMARAGGDHLLWGWGRTGAF